MAGEAGCRVHPAVRHTRADRAGPRQDPRKLAAALASTLDL